MAETVTYVWRTDVIGADPDFSELAAKAAGFLNAINYQRSNYDASDPLFTDASPMFEHLDPNDIQYAAYYSREVLYPALLENPELLAEAIYQDMERLAAAIPCDAIKWELMEFIYRDSSLKLLRDLGYDADNASQMLNYRIETVSPQFLDWQQSAIERVIPEIQSFLTAKGESQESIRRRLSYMVRAIGDLPDVTKSLIAALD